MFCSNCGKSLLPEEAACPHCGAYLGENRFAGSMYTAVQTRVHPGDIASASDEKLSAFTRTNYMSYDNQPDGDVYSNTTYRPLLAPEEEPPAEDAFEQPDAAEQPTEQPEQPKEEQPAEEPSAEELSAEQTEGAVVYDDESINAADPWTPEAEEEAPQDVIDVDDSLPELEPSGISPTVMRFMQEAEERQNRPAAPSLMGRVISLFSRRSAGFEAAPEENPADEQPLYDETQQDEAQYDEAQYDEAQYDETQYDETQQDEAQYDETQYDEAQYDETQQDETQQDETQYDEAQYDETQQDETQYGEAQYGEAQYGEAQYDETQYDETQYDETQYDETQYDETQYDETQYDETQYDDQSFDADEEADSGVESRLKALANTALAKAKDYAAMLLDLLRTHKIVRFGLIAALILIVLIFGIQWLLHVTTSYGTKIAGVTHATYSQGIELIERYASSEYCDEKTQAYALNPTYAQQEMDKDMKALNALTPETPQENDQLFVTSLTNLYQAIQTVIKTDAEEKRTEANSPDKEASLLDWQIVRSAVSKLKDVTNTSQLTVLVTDVKNAIMATPTPGAPAPVSTPAPLYSTLRQGDKNNASVKKMQQRLIDLGYLTGKADGDFGPKTAEALKAFQTAAGLSADGIGTAQTQEALFAADAPAAPQPEEGEDAA